MAVPAPGVVQAIRDCGTAGIPFAVVLTAGFRETGAEGRKLEEELKRALAETGVRIVGPNCQGMLSVEARVWTVFGSVSDETELQPGSVSCAFQSGGFGYAIVNLAEAQGVGFRYCVSSGNEVDITTPELLSAFLDDPGTSLAFAYLEGTPDARRLLDLGRKSMETGKPVLIWKAGTTDAGIKAAASHTANMTGSYDLYRAAMRQCGLIEVDDVEPIVDIARLFAQGREPDGSTDRRAVDLGRLRRGVCRRRRARRPDAAALCPRDAGQDARAGPGVRLAGEPGRHHRRRVHRRLALCPHARGGAGGPGPRPAVDPARVDLRPARRPQRRGDRRGRRQDQEARARRLVGPARQVREGRQDPGGGSRAVRHHAGAAGAGGRGAGALCRRPPAPAAAQDARTPKPSGVELPAGAVTLNEAESKAVLQAFGVPVVNEVFVAAGARRGRGRRGASKAPFAVKVVSRDVPHKTEAGGVRLGVAREALSEAARSVTDNARKAVPGAKIDGVLVSEMAQGLETLIGVINDPGFGPVVALGLGGVLTEVLKDVTYRVAPFDLETAREMIAELRAAKLFEGYRGKPAADKEALAQALVAVSGMAVALAPRLKELDINPVFVRPAGQGVVAADALVVSEIGLPARKTSLAMCFA